MYDLVIHSNLISNNINFKRLSVTGFSSPVKKKIIFDSEMQARTWCGIEKKENEFN